MSCLVESNTISGVPELANVLEFLSTPKESPTLGLAAAETKFCSGSFERIGRYS